MSDSLFEPERHEILAAAPWDEGAARSAIERIAADAYRDFGDAALWPAHHSLWTGDIGLAVYLASCIRADGRFPTLDFF